MQVNGKAAEQVEHPTRPPVFPSPQEMQEVDPALKKYPELQVEQVAGVESVPVIQDAQLGIAAWQVL